MTAMSQPMQVLTSQQSVEWYTPLQYVEMVREVLGDIELDYRVAGSVGCSSIRPILPGSGRAI